MKLVRLSAPYVGLVLLLGLAASPTPADGGVPRLKVSGNHRYLVYEDGRPFF